jgi:hypothetical protein
MNDETLAALYEANGLTEAEVPKLSDRELGRFEGIAALAAVLREIGDVQVANWVETADGKKCLVALLEKYDERKR